MNDGTVPFRWSKLDAQREWMLAHGGGRPIASVRADFEREFGTPISKSQVTLFRQEYGLCRRSANRVAHTRRHARPVGYERPGKSGYIMVKVRELADRPGSKDNWELKHRHVFEVANGRKLRKGEVVVFADGDRSNFDPGNLVAVEKADIGPLNESGIEWRDRETLEAALACVRLRRGISDAVNGERACGVCGKRFKPDNRCGTRSRRGQRTCRECLDAGLRAPKDYGTAACPRCGKEFRRASARQVYCSKRCRYEDYRERRAR